MRLLLDTNVFLWLNDAPERLGDRLALIEDTENARLVSSVVALEVAIKVSIGKLTVPTPTAAWFTSRMEALVADPVPIEPEHALGVAELPLHHRDPFDRLLVSQARALGVPILTADRVLAEYPVEALLIES